MALSRLRRRAGAVLLILLSVGCGPAPQAPGECSRVEILVGFGIGGGTDLFARHLAEPLAAELDVPVNVLNITAGGGIAAFRELQSRAPDGCSLLAVTSDYPILTLYEPDTVRLTELALIARAHTEFGLLLTAAGSGESWPELVARAQRAARPLLIGGVGARSFDRAAVSITLEDLDGRYRYIPYGGSKEMQADLLGGRLDAIYDEFGVMKGMLDSGLVEALLVFHDERIAMLPDTPAVTEYGLNVAPPIWRGVAMRAGAPPATTQRIGAAVASALQSTAYRDYEESRYLHVSGGFLADTDGFSASVRREVGAFRQALSP